ncbi:MAG: succinate dehydrogenase assembly factor 2 [Gammaproteobacteria bacterium]|nr:succinate dehydrogenase assembly factor 2 [Gammaproteobacteria bacterium]
MHKQTGPDRNRLSWQCRRGMRELDELLMRFLTRRYSSLDAVEQKTFELLLEYPDAVLLELLMGRMTPADKNVANIVQEIRNTFAV